VSFSSTDDPQQQIIDRATSDPDFRNRLVSNPNETISQALGVPLPRNVAVRVIEEQPGEVVLVLPAQPAPTGSQLSDADLEAVAGGGTVDSWGGDLC
jgi:hypothetical protein